MDMMNLVIDQGNSSAKVAVFDTQKEEGKNGTEKEREDAGKMVYYQKYELFSVAEAKKLCEKFPIGQAIISTVMNDDDELNGYLKERLYRFVRLDNETPLPIEIRYKTPQTLGRDRVAVCVGANYLKPNRNLLVIDAGTAITYDIVNSKNQYVGGNISLGIEMRRQALHTFTAKLPLVEVEDDEPLVGTTTEEAIASGIVNGVTCEMQGYIDEVSSVYPDLLLFLTGGSGKCFEKRIKKTIFANPKLVHIGLNRILTFSSSYEQCPKSL